MALFPMIDVRALWRPQRISELDGEMETALGGAPSLAGVTVSENLALNYTAVYACVKVLGETLAGLPCHLNRRDEKRTEHAEDHPAYALVHDAPNDESTAFDWIEAQDAHIRTWGNAYAWLDIPTRGRLAGQVRRILPLRPDRVRVYRDESGRLKYKYHRRNFDGSEEDLIYDTSQILHIPGLSYDGIVGYSPISMARQAVGMGLALEEFGSRFFSQGSHIGGVLTTAGVPKDLTFEQFKRDVREQYEGLGGSHRLMILTGGAAEYKPMNMPLEDAEFIASRTFQLEEIARIYRVPLHMIQNLQKATFSNIEHQSLEFAVFTMMPWIRRWEQRLNMKLLTEAERRNGYYFKFEMRALMRGDAESRANFYKAMREISVYNPNKILELEDENPRQDPGGDSYWDQGPSGQSQKASQTPPNQSQKANLEPVLRDCLGRITARRKDILDEATKRGKKDDESGMRNWLKGFYQRHVVDCADILQPYFEALNQPERALKEAKTLVESLRMSIESSDLLDVRALEGVIREANLEGDEA